MYTLPALPYGYDALAPYISEQQLRIHHDKHHQAYVNGANELLQKINSDRQANSEFDVKAIARGLSFNIGGYILHSLFWENLRPVKDKKLEPDGAIKDLLLAEFLSFERFKSEFSKAAQTGEGSAWAALSFCPMLKKPIIMQIEKHNLCINPAFPILLVLDVWEHAYYLDYKNERAKFIEAFWNIVNWDCVNQRLNGINMNVRYP